MTHEAVAADFLNGYEKLIFDMDGVLTSEQNYWNAAALAVYELLCSKHYFGTQQLDFQRVFSQTAQIRDALMYGDKTIALLKNQGINTNWDLAYVLLAGITLLDDERDYSKVYSYFKEQNLNVPMLYEHACELLSRHYTGIDCTRFGELWTMLQTAFNEWYYGIKYFSVAYNRPVSEPQKPGFMEHEQPLHSIETTKYLLETLNRQGFKLAIGTGRPQMELEVPLKNWGLLQYFEKDACITHNHIIKAQEEQTDSNISLAKPHPFVFLKAAYGVDYSTKRLLEGDYDMEYIKKVLIIGDAGADILAAQNMGADFAAVLTGVSGQATRGYFEKQGANYILNSVNDLIKRK